MISHQCSKIVTDSQRALFSASCYCLINVAAQASEIASQCLLNLKSWFVLSSFLIYLLWINHLLQFLPFIELTCVYFIIIDGVFILLVLYHTILNLFYAVQTHTLHFVLKHLVYLIVLCQRRFLKLWTHWYLLLQFVYWEVTLSCINIEVKTLTQAGARADTLNVIQLVSLFFKKHFSFIADLIKVLLLAYWQIHSSIETLVFVLSLFHALVNVITDLSLFFQNDLQLYGFIVRLTHCWIWKRHWCHVKKMSHWHYCFF